MYLSRETVTKLPAVVKVNGITGKRAAGAIVHFGVGGFHRSHQAFAIQRLMELDAELYAKWSICGVCIMPGDKDFVARMKKQDLLYTLKVCASGITDEVIVMDPFSELLFGPENNQDIIDRIASSTTKLISFTITEGGYRIDEATGVFDLQHPDIQHDLDPANAPKTVFGFLARGLQQRMKINNSRLTLLSCDNIQGNGQVLKKALQAFIDAWDPSMNDYVTNSIVYPNSMVDRITPVTKESDRNEFERQYGYKDDCLVVCEPFFQWVIEKNEADDFPPLEKAGVTVVDDVHDYESMKLRILNGGHSLIGLTGKAMQYEFIHDAIGDERISALFDLYNEKEVIPTLNPLKDVDYEQYASRVKQRFSNALIGDSTVRIISGSTAKIPKFVLPVITSQVTRGIKPVTGALIVAAWWHYLDSQITAGKIIDDPAAEVWKRIFLQNTGNTLDAFLNRTDVFGELSNSSRFRSQVAYFAELIRKENMLYACEQAIKSLV